MSVLTIALFALGYVIVILFVLALLRTAKRADRDAQREYDAVVRSLTQEAPLRLVREHDAGRVIVKRRRVG